MDQTCTVRWPRSRHPRNRRITLPLAIAAVAALCTSTVAALPQPHAAVTGLAGNLPPLVVDNGPIPQVTAGALPFVAGPEELRLRRRADDETESKGSTAESKSGAATKKASPTSSAAPSGSDSDSSNSTATSTASPSQTSSALPEPFDTPLPALFQEPGLSNSKCPSMILDLLDNPTFKKCYPISMLMQTSTGFFNARKSLLTLVPVVDASCRADVRSCNDFMTRAAANISSDAGCKAEMQANQTAVWQTYRGLSSYQALYAATCIQDSTTSSYCFTNAVTNISTPSDAYMYFMPYGMPLPGSSTPSCNWCNQQTMGIYHSAASNRQQLVAGVYEAAATQINTICGINFVNATLPPASSAGTTSSASPTFGVLVTAGVIAVLWML